MRIIGVIPAAGQAHRLRPAGSKEMCLVGGRPVIDYVVERMQIGGVEELRIVTRPEKYDVIDHAATLGANLRLANPATMTASFLIGAQDAGDDDVLLLGFPDSVWSPADAFTKVVAAVHDGSDICLGLFQSGEPERGDVVLLSSNGQVGEIHIKPARPPSNWIWGCFAGRANAFADLSTNDELASHFTRRARLGTVVARRFGRIIDIGTAEALARADQELGLL